MTDAAPPKRSGLKNFLLNLLINFAVVWLASSLLILALGFLYKLIFWPIVSLGLSLHIHKFLGVAIVIGIILIIALLLTLLTLGKFISTEIAARFKDLHFIKFLDIVNRIRKGGMAFPEVTFQHNETGDYISGVLMSRETEEPVPDSDRTIPLNNVWEVRPASAAGKLHRLKDGSFKLTGRPGWKTVRRAWSWGLIGN